MEALHNYIAEISMVIGLIVWSIRLEGKVSHIESINTKQDQEIELLDARLRDFDSKILNKLSEIAERLSYIEGAIKGAQKDRD